LRRVSFLANPPNRRVLGAEVVIIAGSKVDLAATLVRHRAVPVELELFCQSAPSGNFSVRSSSIAR
jgi:hypothetical protein